MIVDLKYQIGACIFDYKFMTLTYQNESIKLSSQVRELLLLFVESADHVVSREEAIQTIWQGNEGVGKKGFTNAIWLIRKAFKDLGVEDEVFNTLPKLGYQLTLPIEVLAMSAESVQHPRRYLWGVAIVSFILVMTLLYLFSANPPAEIVTTNPESSELKSLPEKLKITNFEGVEEHVAVSHDGRRLAMQWRTDSLRGKIYLKDLTQNDSPLTLISFGNNEEASPAWSQHDNKLAYVRIEDNKQCQIRVRDLVNNTDILVASDCFYIPFKRVVSWSNNDDNKLIYAKQYHDFVALESYSLDTGISQQMTFPGKNEVDFAPKWLKDDVQLAFIRERSASNSQSLVLQHQSGESSELISRSVSIVDFDYSQSSELFYVSTLNGGAAIVSRLAIDGTALSPLNYAGLLSGLSVSDINRKLYVTEHISKEYIVQQSYIDGSVLRKISSSSRDMYARYSQTTNDILFMSNRSALWSIWKNNGVSSKNLTKSLGNVNVPAISPVNTDFAANISVNGVPQLFLGDINSESFRAIDINGIESENLSWSKDGQYLYFKGSINNESGIYKLNVKSGELQLVTQNNAVYALEGETPSIIYMSRFNEDGVWRFNRDTGELTLVTPHLAQFDFGSFYYEQGYIYSVVRSKDNDLIERIAVTGGEEAEVVQQFPANSIRRFFGLSAGDGESFLATLKVANEADIFGVDL